MNDLHREGTVPPRALPYVVGVGASAGGLEALEQLFSAMPDDVGVAFVIIQHLSPDFKSMMDELLKRRTRLPVVLVEDGIEVHPNTVYLIPAKKEMIISEGRLLLSDKGSSPELTLPIDIFFRSLAEDAGPRAIGIVLSGGGSDGSRGIRDIHAAGGLAICQDESAAFDGMPRNARETGVIDHVVPPTKMPKILLEHVRRLEAAEKPAESAEIEPRGIGMVFRRLAEGFGIDFSHYKPSTVVRRIERRMAMTRAPNIRDYAHQLVTDHAELDALYRDLLIGVTRFFRDSEAFDQLARTIIPEILRTTSASEELRLWVPGCATGEEAYSLAILVHEELERLRERRRIKIFATDVHSGSLDFAARGLYSSDSIGRLTPRRLDRYFDRQGPSYQVTPELREYVVFARHNVMRDAPFTRVDLVSCRNLLIYFQPPAQRKVLSLFHFALKRHGVMFLGPSETAGSVADDFETLDPHWKIYRKQRDMRGVVEPPLLARTSGRDLPGPPGKITAPLGQVISLYDTLLSEYMPPSILINDQREVVHTFGGAGKLIKIKDGRPSLDLFDMVDHELKLVLSGAIQRARKERAPIVYKGLRLDGEGEGRRYRLTVKPIGLRNAPFPHLLVSLEESEPLADASAISETEIDIGEVSRAQLTTLEAELRYTKESLQATIEELETSNEELQATNEELHASNEELQSTNEELQSVNEELYTVNAEYQKKIAQLTELTNDVDALLLSTEVGTIFLDRDMSIRKFTPRIAEAFNLLPQDVGRPIGAFTSTLSYTDLMEDLREVIESGVMREREVRDHSGNWYFARVLPYRVRGAVEGVVLTLIDIRSLKTAEDALFRERHLLDSLMQNVPDAIYFKDSEGRFVRINDAMARLLGAPSVDAAIGKRASDFLGSEGIKLDDLDGPAMRGECQPDRLEARAGRDGRPAWYNATRLSLIDREGRVVGMCGVARDVTGQKEAENQLRLAVERRDEFLAMLSHELRNPLNAIVSAADVLRGNWSTWDCPTGLDVIERQSRHMTRLLDDLLEVNRLTHNKIVLQREIVDLRRTAEDAVAALRDRFETQRQTVDLDLGSAPLLVDGDPARLQQIIVNLLGNASKYTPAGGRITVRTKADADRVVLAVIDDGCGIAPAMLDNVFEIFVQANTTLSRAEGGMGLGLTLVRALTQLHGGSVTAESDGEGKGCEFTVTLPPAPPGKRETVASPPRVVWGARKRVALIDDNLDSCAMLEAILERAGCEVFCAHDGHSGLGLINEVRPDVAIVDIGLPGMDGYELTRKVRAKRELSDLFIVAVTGYGRPADREAAIQAGFNEHLVKPLHAEDLGRLFERGKSPR